MAFVLPVVVLSLAAAPTPVTRAQATLRPTQGSTIEGVATFATEENGVRVRVRITGLTPGKHGFHVHEFGDCTAPDAMSAGGHFNPTGEPHAGPQDAHRHTGDMGNIEAGADGVADLEYVDGRLAFDGPNAILGRGVIVHANPDDLKTQPTGNAGGRLACGVIGVVKGN